MPVKPRVFVGCSSGAPVYRLAQAVQQNLKDEARVILWGQDAIPPGENIIDGLLHNLDVSDFGVFLFTPDDTVVIQGVEQRAIRDNVLLEFGMFLGRLGKRKSFFIRPNMQNLRLPT